MKYCRVLSIIVLDKLIYQIKSAAIFFSLLALVMIVIGAIRSDDSSYWIEFSMIQIVFVAIVLIIVIISSILIMKSHIEMKRESQPEPEQKNVVSGEGMTRINEVPEAEIKRDSPKSHDEFLIAKLLKPDERRIYGIISSAGGQIFQSKIVTQSGFSKVKVTRLLDKLEERELIVRERDGLSNRVRMLR